jgi:acetylornithine aminotransferase
LVDGFTFVEFNDLDTVEGAVTVQTCAVMVEPVQGEGGVNFPAPGYLKALRELCDRHDLLLVFDEIQTGMGRTGTLFAYEQEDVTPHVMTLAKALGNGLPIGAMMATDQVARAFVPGTHASTFGGTPLVSAAAARVLELIRQPSFLHRVTEVGAYFLHSLRELKARHPVIVEVRGRGLMVGAELSMPGQGVVEKCLGRGAIINCAHNTVLRFVPPLVVSKSDIDALIEILDGVLSEVST